MAEMVRPIGKDAVPFFNLCQTPQVWADDYLKKEAAEAEYQRLKIEFNEIKKAPRCRADQIELFKKAYSLHNENISKQLSSLFANFGADAFNRLSRTTDTPANAYISREVFEAALDQLPPDQPDAMTDEQRQKKLQSIQKKMAQEKEKIKKFTPQSYIQLRNGNVRCDARKELVNFWRDVQALIERPCDPRGIDLELAMNDVKWLHKKLKIGAAILDKARRCPYRP
jgi:hypothetical protein